MPYEVGLDEIRYNRGDDLKTVPGPYWKAANIAEKTADPALHGCCARTKKIGYTLRKAGSEHDGHIVRRAVIQLFSSEGAPLAQTEQPIQPSQTPRAPENQIDNH